MDRSIRPVSIFTRILQRPEVACAVISFRRRTEIFGTGIMHACERRAEFQCALAVGEELFTRSMSR